MFSRPLLPLPLPVSSKRSLWDPVYLEVSVSLSTAPTVLAFCSGEMGHRSQEHAPSPSSLALYKLLMPTEHLAVPTGPVQSPAHPGPWHVPESVSAWLQAELCPPSLPPSQPSCSEGLFTHRDTHVNGLLPCHQLADGLIRLLFALILKSLGGQLLQSLLELLVVDDTGCLPSASTKPRVPSARPQLLPPNRAAAG